MTGTLLEQCQRHLVESAKRIAQQETLLARLEYDGQWNMLSDAHTLLMSLREIQRHAEKHLARELAKLRNEPLSDRDGHFEGLDVIS